MVERQTDNPDDPSSNPGVGFLSLLLFLSRLYSIPQNIIAPQTDVMGSKLGVAGTDE